MSDIETAVGNLKLLLNTEWPYVAVPCEDLEAVLDRLAGLEAAQEQEPELDRLCNLMIGDEVETLIKWGSIPEGVRGTVYNVINEEYPIKVRFPMGMGTVGYKRSELGKVVK
jgi:hypothetical protein